MATREQDQWVIQEFQLAQSLLQQSIGAIKKDRLRREEKLIHESTKIAERLSNWQSALPADQCNCEIANAIETFHKTVLDREAWFEQFRNDQKVHANHARTY